MKISLCVPVLAAALVASFAALPGTAEAQLPGVCAELPAGPPLGSSPVQIQGCGFCSGEDFCPQEGVRCSWLATCTRGPDRCCEYVCECDESCTSVSQPEEACSFVTPTCPECPPRTVCQVSYCGGEGIRCTFDNTCGAGGCCNYACAPDATCTLPDPVPPNAC